MEKDASLDKQIKLPDVLIIKMNTQIMQKSDLDNFPIYS